MIAMRTPSPRTHLLSLLLAVCACTSEEEQICKRQLAFDDPYARNLRLGQTSEAREMSECLETFPLLRRDLELDAAEYADYRNCRAAAKTMRESIDCSVKIDSLKRPDPEAAARAKIDAAAAAVAKQGDEALAKLEALVPGGAIDAATITAMRARRASTPPARLVTIAADVRTLIESGRVAPGTKVQIQLPPNIAMRRPGSMAADILFEDARSSRTVARISPISKALFGSKNDDIADLLGWACDDPDHRDVELEVVSGGATDVVHDPPRAIQKALDALTEAGLDERPLIRVDGEPMTAGEWLKRQ